MPFGVKLNATIRGNKIDQARKRMLFLDRFLRRITRSGLPVANPGPFTEEDDFRPRDSQQVTEHAQPRILLPWLALAIGIPLSGILALAVQDSLDNVARLRFERQTGEAKAVIEDRIHFYTDVLYGLKAHFASLDHVTRLQFHRVVESLDLPNRYPGFDLLSYATYVPLKDKEKFEQEVRHDRSLEPRGYPSFAINPPGIRPEYYVISYLEPMSGFEFAFGLDMAANPEARNPALILKTLQFQRDTGKLGASGVPLKLLSKTNSVGLAMRLAVYRTGMPVDTVEQRRAAYIGSVGAGYNVAHLMSGVVPQELVPAVRFKLFDAGPVNNPGGAAVTKRLLYDSQGQQTPQASVVEDDGAVLESTLPFEVGGRIWKLEFGAPKSAVAEPFEKRLPLIVFLGGVLISSLLFGVLYSLASSRRTAIVLANEITKDLYISNRHLQKLSRQLVDVQEADRRHFSRELHDQIGQNLTALGINIDILKTEMSENSQGSQGRRLDQLAELVESTTSAIENVMSDLRPPMLDDYGLLPALEWYSEEFSKRTGIATSVHGDEKMQRLPPTTEIALFRISQEALNNVAKHAQASNVKIDLYATNRDCVLTIADDGIGFAATPASNARRRHGMGMMTMRERSQAINGRFDFGAAPSGGSRVVVRAPYQHAD
jgi:signal transduction histidine kinase